MEGWSVTYKFIMFRSCWSIIVNNPINMLIVRGLQDMNAILLLVPDSLGLVPQKALSLVGGSGTGAV